MLAVRSVSVNIYSAQSGNICTEVGSELKGAELNNSIWPKNPGGGGRAQSDRARNSSQQHDFLLIEGK